MTLRRATLTKAACEATLRYRASKHSLHTWLNQSRGLITEQQRPILTQETVSNILNGVKIKISDL